MRVVTNLAFVRGLYKDEQGFKQDVIKSFKQNAPFSTVFEIENEEKEPGMPDLLSIERERPAFFTETKYADKNGVIEFQKTQSLFYRKHPKLMIQILAWDTPRNRCVYIHPEEVIAAKSLKIKLPDKLKVMAAEDDGENAG
jgi:hypothetical protein